MPAAAKRDTNLQSAVISFSNTGDNTVVAAVTNQSIRVYRLFFVVSADTNIVIKNGSTALTGTITMFAGGTFLLDVSREPWFTTTVGNAFVINQSGTANIGGKIDFQQP